MTNGILQEINGHLRARQLFLKEGTLVDATTIAGPPSTKNTAQLHTLYALANLVLGKRRLLAGINA